MRTFARLLRFLTPYRWRVALAVLLGVGTVVANTGLLATAAYIISKAALKPLLIELTGVIYLVRFFGIARAAVRYEERLVSHNVTFRLLATLRAWFYRRLEPLAPGGLGSYRSGDLLSRIIKDIEELEGIYQQVVAPVLIAALTTLLAVGVFQIFSPTLALAALGFLAAAGIGVPLLASWLGRRSGRRQLELRAALNAQLVDGLQGIQDLLACGREDDQRERIATLDRELARVQRRMACIAGMQGALGDLVTNIGMWTVLVLAIPLVRDGRIGGVYLAMLALVMLGSFEAVRPLGRAFQFLGQTLQAGERLFAVADAKPAIEEPADSLPAPAVPTLEFDHVGFAYAPDEARVLDEVTFTLRPGERLAVVGPSGSAKSTLVRLAVRFWDPLEGEIRLGGRDLRGYARDILACQIGVVAQDTYLFTGTVRANLLLARPEATDAELEEALRRARLDDLVGRLPNGLDTWIGEQGLQISGGERRRLAIARALLANPPILVLDEPTANLDPITESDVLAAIGDLMRERATLLMTHRLVHMEGMDEILVLHGGRILERGTHVALCRAGGLYARMLEAQNQILALG